jgi:hypothetical protein
MSEGLGDHVTLLRLWQLWEKAGFSKEFCRQYGLDLRGMNFAKEIRKQLEGVVGHDGSGLERLVAGGLLGGGLCVGVLAVMCWLAGSCVLLWVGKR